MGSSQKDFIAERKKLIFVLFWGGAVGSSFFLHVFLGMSDVSLLSGISRLSFDSPFLSPLLFFSA